MSRMERWRGQVSNWRKLSTKKVGQPPGTLTHVGRQKVSEWQCQLIEYRPDADIVENQSPSLADLTATIESTSNSWVSIIGLHDVEQIAAIGQTFNVHRLLLEDILNTEQRPKADSYEENYFCLLKVPHHDQAAGQLMEEQLALVLGPRYVLTFQETDAALFDGLRQRLINGKGRLRQAGSDYLAYALIDAVVDQYFLVLEQISNEIELIEEEALTDPTADTLLSIQGIRRELLMVRKAAWPMRELLSHLQRGEVEQFRPETMIYLRDIYDHAIQILETTESLREVVTGLIDIYLSTISNRANEVMKVLTIVATIFIPLTFITSLYGMNFDYIPELQWRWGYPLVLAFMLLLSLAMLIYFRRRRWL